MLKRNICNNVLRHKFVCELKSCLQFCNKFTVEKAAYLKMEQLKRWKFTIESETTGQLLTFRLSSNNDTKLSKSFNETLNNKHRYLKCIFPSKDESFCKNPHFAFDYDNIKKKLKNAGYNYMWTLHGLYYKKDFGVHYNPDVQHTTGRKRKRQPTFTIGEEESLSEDEEDTGVKYRKGLLLAIPENNPDSRCEITSILQQHNFRILVDVENKNSDGHWICPVEGIGGIIHALFVVDTLPPANAESFIHPAFIQSDGNLVFHSLEEIKSVLDMGSDKPGIKELQDIFKSVQDLSEEDLKYPLIIVEGLDGSGKSTLIKNLVDTLNAVSLQTPPKSLLLIRNIFDAYPELIRRIYYSLGNYLVVNDIIKKCQSHPVVMDRFWQSTAAYTIATECLGETTNLPPRQNPVYEWPSDLLKPSIVLLLNVTEEQRTERIGYRVTETGKTKTKEEIQLERNESFRKRIMECYRRMDSLKVIEIDADGSKEQILETAMTVLKANKII